MVGGNDALHRAVGGLDALDGGVLLFHGKVDRVVPVLGYPDTGEPNLNLIFRNETKN